MTETSQGPYGAKLIALRKELATARVERDSLAAQLAKAVEALRPFVKLYEAYDAQARSQRADSDIFFNDMFYEVDVDGPYAKVTFGDFREAVNQFRRRLRIARFKSSNYLKITPDELESLLNVLSRPSAQEREKALERVAEAAKEYAKYSHWLDDYAPDELPAIAHDNLVQALAALSPDPTAG